MLFKLFKSFFLIGAFTFGGGSAMIAIMEKELVKKNKWLDIDDFLDLISLAQASPGAMAVNASIIVGYRLNGFLGAIISCLGTILPSFLIMIGIGTVFGKIKNSTYVEKVFYGIRPVVAALMASSVLSMAVQSKFKIIHYLVLLAVAILISFADLSPILFIIVGGLGYLMYRIIKDRKEKL